MNFEQVTPYKWKIPASGDMRVPGMVYASREMLPQLDSERVSAQVSNVAALPGITGYSFAMPDAHWGYGFPIGGVAAMDCDGGVISPGGVGYDISCGVRLLRTSLSVRELGHKMGRIADAVFAAVPSGVGVGGSIRLDARGVRSVFELGARWAVAHDYGSHEDLEFCEDAGRLREADPGIPSTRAIERGMDQLGTLGSGNHFIELQEVEEIYDKAASEGFGLFKGQLVILLHTGSRGCGYQICEDFIHVMDGASKKYGIVLRDRQLVCAPVKSREGRDYIGAMNCAGNYAKANRQVITQLLRNALMKSLGIGAVNLGLSVVYDLSHNMAKFEEHEVGGRTVKLCVHRKGATRAFPAGHSELPPIYRSLGQPVLVPGSMGTRSYVLVGQQSAMSETFGSVCHGAGRLMSRTQAAKMVSGEQLKHELSVRGIEVRTGSLRSLAEEVPMAYKDVSAVVDICVAAGLAKKAARMKPLGVIKG